MDQLKTTDPKNSRLSGLESKYKQMERRVAAKTKSTAPAKTAVAPPNSGTKSGGDKLPYAVRQSLGQAEKEAERLKQLPRAF